MARDFTIDTQNFISDLRQDIWEFGNLAWLFALGDRFVTAFSHGLPSAIDLIQVFTIALLSICWLFLDPNSDQLAEKLYNVFQPAFPTPVAPPTLEKLQRLGYQQTSAWRGWNVHHTVIPNSTLR